MRAAVIFLGLLLLALTILLLMASGVFDRPAHPWQWAESPPPPTLPPALAATPQAAQAAAQATIMAGQAVAVNLNITATAVALNIAQAKATQDGLLTQTAEAARATDTAIAQAALTSTAEAGKTATAIALEDRALARSATQTFMAITVEAASNAVRAQSTALFAQAEKAQLEVEQQRMMNQVWAVTKWGLVVVFVLLIAFLAHRLTAWRVIKRENGKVLVLTNGVVYDPDRNPTPVLQLGPGKAELPPVSPDAQAATTARDQAIALAATLGGRKPPSVLRQTLAAGAPASPMPPARIEVLPPERIHPWLDEVEGQLPPPGPGKEENP